MVTLELTHTFIFNLNKFKQIKLLINKFLQGYSDTIKKNIILTPHKINSVQNNHSIKIELYF